MTERDMGGYVQSWVGVVTNVMDPHQSGRVQIRVFGRHDDVVNIPDEDLPWAQVVQPVTSAAIGRIGTAPVGLVVGSRVYGNWLDRDQQYPIIVGTVGRAGTPVPGQTENGSPAVNTAFGSIPSATQGSQSNPYSNLDPNRIPIELVNAGVISIENVNREEGVTVTTAVEEGMQFATLPTTASADPGATNILAILQQVDPRGTMSALPCLPGAASELKINIDLSSIATGFINMLADAFNSTLIRLMEQLGVNAVISAVNNAAFALENFRAAFDALQSGGLCAAPAALNRIDAGTQALVRSMTRIQSAADRFKNSPAAISRTLGGTLDQIQSRAPTELFRPLQVSITAPAGYVQEYYSFQRDPYPGYIRWRDPAGEGDPVFTLRNGQPNFTSPQQHSSFDVSRAIQGSLANLIRTGTLNTGNLQNVLLQATGVAQVSALSRAIGSGNPLQIIALGARLIPSIYSNIVGIFNARISVSVLPSAGAIEQSVERFTQSQSILAIRRAQMENAFRRI